MGRWSARIGLGAGLIAACSDSAQEPPSSGLGDAGQSPTDAGTTPGEDAGSEPGGDHLCRETAPRFSAPFRPDGRGFDLLVSKLDVHLVYAEAACSAGSGDALGHRLRYVQFTTAGEVPEPSTFEVVADGLCAKVRDPSVTLVKRGDASTPTLDFLSTREGSWELFRRAGVGPDVPYVRLSDPDSNFVISLLAAGVDGSGASLSATVEKQDPGSALLAYHGGDITPWLSAEAGVEIVALSLGARTSDGVELPLAAFLGQSDTGGLYLLPLAADGSAPPLPAPRPVQFGGAPALALAAGLEGAALVYTEGTGAGEELRFLAVDEAGAPLGAERKLTTANERARDPDIAPFVSGYAVAFRAVRADQPERAVLRLAFMDAQGNLAGFRDVLETSAGGGAVQLQVAVDGRLVLGFAEIDEAGDYSLEVARVTCGTQG